MDKTKNTKILRRNKEGLFYLQYEFSMFLSDPSRSVINEYFTESEALRRRKAEIANSFWSNNVTFLSEGTAIVENGVIMPDNKTLTVAV